MLDRTKPSEWISQKRTRSSIREAAREIREHIDKWFSQKETATAKWFWELIQNARDEARKRDKKHLEARFILDENHLIFEHNAGPFSLNDIYALVNGRSSKPLGTRELIGEFGKGFIVTHIISGRVNVEGWLRDDSIGIDKAFEITLDRTIQASEEQTVTHIADNIEECSKQLDAPGPTLEYDLTRFEYPLDEEGRNIATAGLNMLKETLPFVLAFTKPEMRIKIVQNGEELVYRVAETENIQSQPAKIQLLKLAHQNQHEEDCLIVVSSADSEVRIAVQYSSNNRSILQLGNVPRLFKMYPLAKTAELAIPIIIDAPFRVSPERFDLQYRDDQREELTNILKTAMRLLEELCKWALHKKIDRKELLFRIQAPPEGIACEEQWTEVLSALVIDISQLKIVEAMVDAGTDKTEFLRPEVVYFPSPLVGSDLFTDEKFTLGIWYLSRLLGLRVPEKSLIAEWHKIRNGWKSLAITIGNEQTFENIVDYTDKLENLENLEKKTGHSEKRALAFLKGLYNLCDYYRSQRKQVPEFLERAIYSNQKGDFREPRKLSIDKGVPEDLKGISESLFEPLREKLLNLEFSKDTALREHFLALGLSLVDEERAIGLLYDAIHRNWKQKIGSEEIDMDKYKQGVMEFEKWLLQKKNIGSLLEERYPLRELPFLCEDNKLRIVERKYLVFPGLFLEEDARTHTKLWPPDTKLSSGYSKDITDLTLVRNRLVDLEISKPNLFFMEETRLQENQIKEMSLKAIRIQHPFYASATYVASAMVSKVIAFDRVLEFAEQTKNPDLTRDILIFVLGFLVPRDRTWNEIAVIKASEMGHSHIGLAKIDGGRERDFQICPCLWLSQMKNKNWVITSSVDEDQLSFDAHQPTEEWLVDFLKELKPSILGDETVQIFLQQKFGIKPLEMTGWLLTGGESEAEQVLINNLKQIYELADTRKVDPVNLLSEMLYEKMKGGQFNQRNRNFGLVIERTVRKVFKQLKFEEYGFKIVPRWKGYDFDAYLRKKIEESDYGVLGIEVKTTETDAVLAKFEVEVKATRVNAVRMTLTQANNAVDHVGSYLLCVVDAKSLPIDVDTLHADSLGEEQIEELAERILPRMSIVGIGEDLMQVINAFRKASSTAQEIRVDYDAKFTIPARLWKLKGKTITDWFTSILDDLGVSTIAAKDHR